MLNSTTLEVAIGMALVYLLLSLFCTAINEVIAGVLGSRAKNLEKGIRSLFTEGAMTAGQDASGKPAKTLAAAVYGHGLVQSLYKSGAGQGVAKWYGSGKNLPSYIPSRTFASALFDLLFPDEIAGPGSAGAPGNLQGMLDKLQKLPESKGKEAITTLVKQSEGDIVKTRQAFERWYDDGMDRAAGWYKRKTQIVLFSLGLVIAVALNVDSIEVGRVLWTNPALRSYSVAAAEQYAKGNGVSVPSPAASKDLAALQSLALPIGWNKPIYPWTNNTYGWLFAVTGWLLTAIAVTLGAPFWFDTLNQIMVVRSTIKPREKSEVEASKDPKQK
jgi:hypothetical protein